MPKHRSTVYTVIRERKGILKAGHEFDAIIGTYVTINRAEEVAGAMQQGILDAGAHPGEFKFSVRASTYYDE